jgi:soluble lytic murein transglycosylase-like protein
MVGSGVPMKVRLPVKLAIATCVLVGASVSSASAEIVFLTSGRTLSVKGHRLDGALMVLSLRAGGEVTFDSALVDKIVPDEVPHPDPQSEPEPAAAQETPKPPAINVQALLDSTPYGEIISAMSEAHGVDPLLVRALIQVESNYEPRAKSHKGAMGLMQLMPQTAREYKVRNPYDPKSNVEAGIKKLKSLIDKWGVELALAAYNAGEGAVQRFNGIPPYRETRDYVTRILSLWRP